MGKFTKVGDVYMDLSEVVCFAEHSIEMEVLHVVFRGGKDAFINCTLEDFRAAMIRAGFLEDPDGEKRPPLTDAEKTALSALLSSGYRWIARDADSSLYAYRHRPRLDDGLWADRDCPVCNHILSPSWLEFIRPADKAVAIQSILDGDA